METTYKFLSETEPTDEQLHLLMMEVAADSKKKSLESDSLFWEQLQQMVDAAKKNKINKTAQAK
jgi:hypothetical protein